MYNTCNYRHKCENDVRLQLEAKFFIFAIFVHWGSADYCHWPTANEAATCRQVRSFTKEK